MRNFRLAVMLIGFLIAFPAVSQAQLELYDDFNAARINPAKWHGTEGTGGVAAPNGEIRRRIVGKRLELNLTSYGEASSNFGTSGEGGRNRLEINDPAGITALQAAVAITEAQVEGCLANSTRSISRARINLTLFNNGDSSGEGDAFGDVRARIEKRRDSANNDRIVATLSRCTDADCDGNETIGSVTFSTTWTPGIPDTLKIVWDVDNSRVLFSVNPGTGKEETRTIFYGQTVAGSPGLDLKDLRVQHNVANCLGDQKRATMTALFERVMVQR